MSDLRVVEYGNLVAGPYAARLLADAGADVIKVEPLAGDDARRRGPFPGDDRDPNWSGLYLYLNANKRGLALDVENQRGAKVLRDLLRQADVLIVNHPPSALERLQLRRSHLREVNPSLIVTAITPFGLTGPYRDYSGDDLIAVNSGGLAYATPGLPDMARDPEEEPPLKANTPIGEFLAGIQAAIATMVAVTGRRLDGEGREVDVSQQEAVAMLMVWEIAHASYLQPNRRGPVDFGSQPNAYLPCKDGYVVVVGFLDHHWERLVDVMGGPDWAQSEVFANGSERARNWDALSPLLLTWTMQHTGQEIALMAQEKGVPCFPAYTVGQMMESEHVQAREYLSVVDVPGGKKLRLPGHPVRMQATPWSLRRPAPKLGEHTGEVLREWLGSSAREPRLVERPGRDRRMRTKQQPLDGVRVVDIGQFNATPFAAQVLGWLGAEVICIESAHHMALRVVPPYADGIPGVNRSGGFNLVNTNKLSCRLNLNKPEGVELAKRLIAVSDVVLENNATGAMGKLGLDYESVRKVRRNVIYLSNGAFGRSGPMKNFLGFHSVINMFSGLAALTGYPGGHPRALGGAFPDFLSSCYCVLAVLEALHHRARTGEGQYIEVAMTEALTTLMPEAMAEYSLNGRESDRVGNRDKEKAPHNVYRCSGEQQWVAISVSDDGAWQALCKVAGQSGWATDPRFLDGVNRRNNQEALDALIDAWTSRQDRYEVVAALQCAGVAATPVLDSGDLLRDPHLVERGFVVSVEHPETGRRPMGSLAWAIDGTRPAGYRPAPLLGQHTAYVLKQLLDLSPEEIRRLEEDDVLS